MEKHIIQTIRQTIRRRFLVAGTAIAGVLALVAGYAESQAVARFELDAVSSKTQTVFDESTEPSTSIAGDHDAVIAAKAKVKKAATSHSLTEASERMPETRWVARSSGDVSDEQGGLMSSASRARGLRISVRAESIGSTPDERMGAEISQIEVISPPVRADIESLKLLAGAQERLFHGVRVAVHKSEPAGN